MKRISISLPDSLYGRMQKYRELINYSRVAREAIEKEIRKYEFREDSIRDLAETIERFRREKDMFMDNWQKEGFEWGQNYITHSAFAEADAYMEALPELLEINQPWPDEQALDEYTHNYKDDPEFTTTAATSLWVGFAKGAQAIWHEIKDQI